MKFKIFFWLLKLAKKRRQRFILFSYFIVIKALLIETLIKVKSFRFFLEKKNKKMCIPIASTFFILHVNMKNKCTIITW